MVELLGAQFGSFLQNILLPYDIVIALVGVFPKELKIYTHTEPKMFIAAVFIISKIREHSRCP